MPVRRGQSATIAQRLSNSVTPRAPRRWRTVVGRVDQRSAADASPNHRRLLLGFRHLPSISSEVRTYPRKCLIGGIADSLGPRDYPQCRPPSSDRAAARCMHLIVRGTSPDSSKKFDYEGGVASSGSRSASGVKIISSSTSGRRISICASRSKTSLSAAVSGGWVIERGQSR